MLVLLADVVLLTEVDQEYDRLGGKKEERVDDLDLANCKLVSANQMQSSKREVV
jgi:hypothetical protein